MSLSTEWDQPKLRPFDVWVDGHKVYQIEAVNKAHADYLIQHTNKYPAVKTKRYTIKEVSN